MTSPGRVLWEASADLDGDGQLESIRLVSNDIAEAVGDHENNHLINVPVTGCRVAAERCAVELRVGDQVQSIAVPAGYFGGLGIELVDLDRADPHRELLLRWRGAGEGEDPWYEHAVAFYDGRALRLQELWHGTGYGGGVVTLDGEGRLSIASDECPDTVTVVYRTQGWELLEDDRHTVRTSRPQECAACPRVYLLAGDRFEPRGEILRDLRGPELRAQQALALSPDRSRRPGTELVIELREEKDEVTFLDEVYLEVGDRRIDPADCGAARYCAADGAYHLLHRGDRLRLTFSLEGTDAGSVRLIATGYYVPR